MRTRPAAVLSVFLAAALLAGCGGDDAGSGTTSAKTTSTASKAGAGGAPAPGAVYEGQASDGSAVAVEIDDAGLAAVKLGHELTCNGDALPQESDLGPFPVEDGEIDFPNPGGEGSLIITGAFDGETVSGTAKSDAYEDSKLGSCEAVDITWEAKQTKAGVAATGEGGAFEAGEEIVSSDFEDGADEWEVGNTAASFSGVEDGGLRINARTEGVVGVPLGGDDNAKLTDVVVTATAQFRAGDAPTDTFGISCRRDLDWGYNFYVGRDGRAAIFNNDGSERLEQLATGSVGRAFATGEDFELRAACVGGTLQLSVDDKLVAKAVDDSPWPEGTVALLASGEAGLDVLVDEVEVAEPKG